MTEEVKGYFRKYIECVNLEQNAENERFSNTGATKGVQSGSARETNLNITKVESNEADGVRISLEKPVQ